MANNNQSVGVLTPKSYKHDLSHSHTTTLDWFRLQPLMCLEMVEKDKFTVNLQHVLEAAPLASKVFGSAWCDIHAFFVPKRILWSDWNNYRLGNSRGSTNSYSLPHLNMGKLHEICGMGSVKAQNGTYVYTKPTKEAKEIRRVFGGLGYPTSAVLNVAGDGSLDYDVTYNEMDISAMEARAYQRIWWDWYRDSVHIEESSKANYLYTSGGVISDNERFQDFMPRYRCWRKDYITTLLASPQLGSAAESRLPLHWTSSVSEFTGQKNVLLGNTDGTFSYGESYQGPSGMANIFSSLTVPILRGAIAMQRFLEKLNVTGTRPIERIQSLFGSSPSPVRLDMSEFIGSYRQRLTISGLTNTGSQSTLAYSTSLDNAFGIDDNYSNFGQQQGRSYSEGSTPSFSYSATEDGYFTIIVSIVPEYANPTATNRQFFRGLSTPDASVEDFYTMEFDGTNYQECLYNEICLPEFTESTQGLWGIDYDPFKIAGYQPKYEDYRYVQDRISGDFNEPDSSTALRNMVYTRNLIDGYQSGQIPSGLRLTTPDTEDKKSFDNHFMVTDSNLDHFVLHSYINLDAIRPISKAELPTELSDLANSEWTNVANGGIRM